MEHQQEIERKWLVVGDPPIDRATKTTEIRQGYLRAEGPQVRVRALRVSGKITLKEQRPREPGGPAVRDEREWTVAGDLAEALFAACPWRLTKVRHVIPVDGASDLKWEVDVYSSGLRVVELELPSVDHPLPALPPWVGAEVTGDPRYSNLALAGYGVASLTALTVATQHGVARVVQMAPPAAEARERVELPSGREVHVFGDAELDADAAAAVFAVDPTSSPGELPLLPQAPVPPPPAVIGADGEFEWTL